MGTRLALFLGMRTALALFLVAGLASSFAQGDEVLSSDRWISPHSPRVPAEYQKAVSRLGQVVGKLRVFRFDLREMQWSPAEGGTAFVVKPGDRVVTACRLILGKNPIRAVVDFQDVSKITWSAVRARENYPGTANTLSVELLATRAARMGKSDVCEIPLLRHEDMATGSGYENNPFYAEGAFPAGLGVDHYRKKPPARGPVALVGYPVDQSGKGVAYGPFESVAAAMREAGMAGAPVIELDARHPGFQGSLFVNEGI